MKVGGYGDDDSVVYVDMYDDVNVDGVWWVCAVGVYMDVYVDGNVDVAVD